MTLRFTLMAAGLALAVPGAADEEAGGLRRDIAEAVEAAAEEAALSSPREDPSTAIATERIPEWGLTTSLGFGTAGGDFGDLLESPVAGDFSIFRNRGAWRFGVGLSFTSFTMKEPFQNEDEWGFQQTYLFATRMLRKQGAVRPYLQLRAGAARLHPRSELFAFEPPPEEAGTVRPTPPTGGARGWCPEWSSSSTTLSPWISPRTSTGSVFPSTT